MARLKYQGLKALGATILALSLAACDPVVSEETRIDQQGSTVSSNDEKEPSIKDIAGAMHQGSLPATSIPQDVVGVQKTFQEILSGGVPSDKFNNFEVKPDQTISPTPSNQDGLFVEPGKYRMFLVRAHLVEAKESNCPAGQEYHGWIASKRYLTRTVTEAAMKMTYVRPYKVSVCFADDHLEYQIIGIGNSLDNKIETP